MLAFCLQFFQILEDFIRSDIGWLSLELKLIATAYTTVKYQIA